MFNVAPYGLSLTGQYIVKNIIIIAAGSCIVENRNTEKKICRQCFINKQRKKEVFPRNRDRPA